MNISGMTVWEIFTLGDIPFPSDSWDGDFLAKIEAGIRERKPEFALPEMQVDKFYWIVHL
jgi:hypothetical protein